MTRRPVLGSLASAVLLIAQGTVVGQETPSVPLKVLFYLTWDRQHVPDMPEGAEPAALPEYARTMSGGSGAAKTTDLETRCQKQDFKTIHASEPQPVSLIFDTDMMGDVDDVGTTAVLHALADQNEVKILAMGVCVKNPWSPLCLDALNTYFRRPDIPLGVVKGPAHNRASKYAQGIAEGFPHALKSAEDAPDAALVYRRVLAGQPDGSVVMVSVGQLTNFRNLLTTGPDDRSNLGGAELVKRKVRAWVCMGGKFPEGREANLINDGPAAAYAIEHWPTSIVFSGWEIGQEIMTGAGLRMAPEGTPVRRAYELYNGLNDRQSWDQTAVLYAVRGLDGGLTDFWDSVTEGCLHVNNDGSDAWRTTLDKDHTYLIRKMDPKKIAAVIEELMLRQPGSARR